MAIFFNEFNRYKAKSESGQVFTPDHITSFMYRITNTTHEDYVLDAACGSGAFLVKAMCNMINEVGGIRTKRAIEIAQTQLFGIEYHYDLPEVEMDETAVGSGLDQAVFLRQTDQLCEELSRTLNTIFMYREENAYTVVRRINDLNRLVRSLARMRSELAEEE